MLIFVIVFFGKKTQNLKKLHNYVPPCHHNPELNSTYDHIVCNSKHAPDIKEDMSSKILPFRPLSAKFYTHIFRQFFFLCLSTNVDFSIVGVPCGHMVAGSESDQSLTL